MKFCLLMKVDLTLSGRAPQGARGLKSILSVMRLSLSVVAPRKGRVD